MLLVNLPGTTLCSLMFLTSVSRYVPLVSCISYSTKVIEQWSNLKGALCSRNKIEIYLHFVIQFSDLERNARI